jgi:Putative transposase
MPPPWCAGTRRFGCQAPSNPAAVTLVLGVVYRTISGFLLRRAGFTRTSGHTGAVTVVQRFGSALNLNVHFHMLFLDGVYLADGAKPTAFRHVSAPGANELQRLVEQIAAGFGQVLERRGLIERDIENAWLAADAEPVPLDDLIGHSITYCIAVGPRSGQKLFTLQLLPARPPAQSSHMLKPQGFTARMEGPGRRLPGLSSDDEPGFYGLFPACFARAASSISINRARS